MTKRMLEVTQDFLEDYIGGRLDAAGARLAEDHLARNPDVALKLRQDHAIRQRLRDMFAPVLAEPIPEHLLRLLDSTDRQVRRGGKENESVL
ncbi:hypothetical protein [Azospirillum sp. B510]|uniref:hypothetical protein n=1 Tax=Azospirillum sp. (strain B510) TaxID=137722 RepID=UPI0005A7DCA5|nr:hypothetical protein [Azospirillum sp. B510]